MAGILRLIALAAEISRVVLAALAAALLAAAALLRAGLSLAVIMLRMLLATLLTTLLLSTRVLATLILTTLVLVRHNTLANNFDRFTIGAVARAECRSNGGCASVLAYVQP
jgi:hypothetical protein